MTTTRLGTFLRQALRSALMCLSFAVVAVLVGPAVAAESPGFVVTPAFGQVEVAGAGTQYELKIANRNSVDQNFLLSTVDFDTLDEQGSVSFLGQPTSELEHKYGLASWMRLEKNVVVVPAGGSASVGIKIENRPTLAPGGHYGAVLATAVTDTGQPVVSRVGVKQVLSALVFAVKESGALRDLRLSGMTFSSGWWRLPARVEQRFQNAGNVQVTPRGVVEARDPRGMVVARGAINEGSTMILPESFRHYKTELTRTGAAWMPGWYTLVAAYRYDGTDTMRTVTRTFWYAGSVVIWAAGGFTLAAVAGSTRWLRGRRKKPRRKR